MLVRLKTLTGDQYLLEVDPLSEVEVLLKKAQSEHGMAVPFGRLVYKTKELQMKKSFLSLGVEQYSEVVFIPNLPSCSLTYPRVHSIPPFNAQLAEAARHPHPKMACNMGPVSREEEIAYSHAEVSKHIQDLINSLVNLVEGQNEVFEIPVSEDGVESLMQMGFAKEAAVKALQLNKNNAIEASRWLSDRIEESDLNQPLKKHELRALAHVEQGFVPNKQALDRLLDMGFLRDESIQALKLTNNDPLRASLYLTGDTSVIENLPPPQPVQLELKYNEPVVQELLADNFLMKSFALHENLDSVVCWGGTQKAVSTELFFQKLIDNPEFLPDYIEDPNISTTLSRIHTIINRHIVARVSGKPIQLKGGSQLRLRAA